MEKLTVTAMLLIALAFLLVSAGNPSETDLPVSARTIDLPAAYSWQADTLPDGRERQRIVKRENDRSVEMVLEDGQIVELKVDGEQIPPARFGEYADLTEELRAELKQAPAPPSPPAAPAAPAAPDAPLPPTPPSPPVPPAPMDRVHLRKSTQVTTEKDADGSTVIRIQEGKKEPRVIRVPAGAGSVIVDGQVVAPGESTVIVEELPFGLAFEGNALGWQTFAWPEETQTILERLQRDQERNQRGIERERRRLERQLRGESDGYFNLFSERGAEERAQMEELRKQEEVLTRQYDELRRTYEKELLRNSAEAERIEWHMEALQKEIEARAMRLQELGDGRFGLVQIAGATEIPSNLLVPETIEVPHLSGPGVYFFTDGAGYFDSKVKGALERQLRRDGFLKGKQAYRLELSGKKLWINGEKQSDEMFEKYRRIYEEATGFDLSKKSRIEMAQ